MNLQTALSEQGNHFVKPKYDPAKLKPGHLHIGIGRFHRAHQAVYTQHALNNAFGDWGIVGLSLRSKAIATGLKKQNNVYSVTEYDSQGSSTEIIGSLKDSLSLSEDAERVYDFFRSETLKIVSLTVTEKGYFFDEAAKTLDASSQEMQKDLADPSSPKTTIGVLAKGIHERSKQDLKLSLMSCDNLFENGLKLRKSLLGFLKEAYPETVAWFEDNVSTPSTMVDRIVPGLSEQQLQELQTKLELQDAFAIETEAFKQWVVEDDFRLGKPAWESAGAQLVKSVAPFEKMKLRLLNAAHSYLAYMGPLRGFSTVDEAMRDADTRKFIEEMMFEEISPELSGTVDVDLSGYCRSLVQRFLNPHLKHKLLQISDDGSLKVQQRWLPTLEERANKGISSPQLEKAISAWVSFWFIGFKTNKWKPNDPLYTQFEDFYKNSNENFEAFFDMFMNNTAVFQSEIFQQSELRKRLMDQCLIFSREGLS